MFDIFVVLFIVTFILFLLAYFIIVETTKRRMKKCIYEQGELELDLVSVRRALQMQELTNGEYVLFHFIKSYVMDDVNTIRLPVRLEKQGNNLLVFCVEFEGNVHELYYDHREGILLNKISVFFTIPH